MAKNKAGSADTVKGLYDDEGVIYLDKKGVLRDKNDASFYLPPPEGPESMRVQMFAMIDGVLKGNQLAAANAAYDRLKGLGASELEVRSLLVNLWMNMTYDAVKRGEKWSEEKLNGKLNDLKRFSEMDEDELDDGLFGVAEDLDENGEFNLDPEALEKKLSEMKYDETGNIYIDGAGRLRDKQDPNFKVPKAKDSNDEMIRLTLYSIVNDCLKPTDEGMPFAKETYDRLRSEGAGDLEARTMMTSVWMQQMQYVFSSGEPDGNTLTDGLSKLKYKR